MSTYEDKKIAHDILSCFIGCSGFLNMWEEYKKAIQKKLRLSDSQMEKFNLYSLPTFLEVERPVELLFFGESVSQFISREEVVPMEAGPVETKEETPTGCVGGSCPIPEVLPKEETSACCEDGSCSLPKDIPEVLPKEEVPTGNTDENYANEKQKSEPISIIRLEPHPAPSQISLHTLEFSLPAADNLEEQFELEVGLEKPPLKRQIGYWKMSSEQKKELGDYDPENVSDIEESESDSVQGNTKKTEKKKKTRLQKFVKYLKKQGISLVEENCVEQEDCISVSGFQKSDVRFANLGATWKKKAWVFQKK